MLHGFAFDPGLTARWQEAVDAHKAHAAQEWPREACGVISEDGRYHACLNIAANTLTSFEISDAEMEETCGNHPLAILHSHPSSVDEAGRLVPPQDSPSAKDMQSQMDWGIPFGITMVVEGGASDPFWIGDCVPRPPILGRVFLHGVNDCYALVRDFHREYAGIEIPDQPRDPEWWSNGGDLYSQFAEVGFHLVERQRDNPLPGDCFTCAVRSPVHNHGGIYLGNGLIIHHLAHRLSTRDPASVWRTKMDHLLRHKDLPDDWVPPEELLK